VKIPLVFLVLAGAISAFAPLSVAALPKDASFKAEGPDYIAEADGKGATEAEAQNDALRTAIAVVMESLGKDTLFTELFLKNPPVTMTWKKLSSQKGATVWTVRLRLVVDDESLRLLYNVSYVSTVSTMLDGAETRLSDAEKLGQSARKAETDGDLGRAMSLYWQARDACDSGLSLLAPIGDAAVFSTAGKKKAPELREVLAAVRVTSVSGYDRIKDAERSLVEDQELESVLSSLEAIEKEIADAENWAGGLAARAARIEGTPRAELKAWSDELEARSRALSDSRLALGRVEDNIPRSKTILQGRIDVARRRIDSTNEYLKSTRSNVDREIRSPAMVRAKRSQNLRKAVLHEPGGALSLRIYSPFGVDPAATDFKIIDTSRFEFSLRTEGAFGTDRGLWVSSLLKKDDSVLTGVSADGDPMKNTGYTQSVDVGIHGRGLFGGGVAWDWLRRLDGENVTKRLAIRALTGSLDDERKLASWLAVLSWEVPYDMAEFATVNYLNVGLESFVRFSKVVELNAGFALRPRENVSGEYDTSFSYNVGAGFRLPKPFMWGLEFAGNKASQSGVGADVSSSYFRLFMEYSL
jgi:hypothetical protein